MQATITTLEAPDEIYRDNAPSSPHNPGADALRPTTGADPDANALTNSVPVAAPAHLGEASPASDQNPTCWHDLPLQVITHIASFLPLNHVPCCLRPANRATAAALPSPRYSTLAPHLPTPPFAFKHHWKREFGEQGMAALTLKQRRKLLRHTARSGVAVNLHLMVELAGTPCAMLHLRHAAPAPMLIICYP